MTKRVERQLNSFKYKGEPTKITFGSLVLTCLCILLIIVATFTQLTLTHLYIPNDALTFLSYETSQYEILTSPLTIDGYEIKPVEVIVGESDDSGTVLKMTLFEGRNRQIRKMCEAAELTVKRLSRVSIGNLKLNNLPTGKWRYLEREEVDYLYKATKG